MSKRLKKKISLTVLRSIEVGDEVRDTELRGFGARRQKDCISFFVQTRVNGKLRWFTIGPLGSPWTADTARKKAHKILLDAREGIDAGDKKKKSREPGTTFTSVADSFLEL